MNTRIIAFAGAKQSGKSTCSNFLHGYQLRAQEVIENFGITDNGKLFVTTNVLQKDGSEQIEDTYLDINRRDQEFIEWAMYNMWPFVKKYSFAGSLKDIVINLFGLTHEQVYGSEEYKMQQVPHLRWENMPGVEFPNKRGPMTVRDFLQYFGTDICREIHDSVWVDRCVNDIKYEEPLLAIIDDCRFENEISAIQEAGGKVIGLSRQPYEDSHASEQVVKDHWDLFDTVIDNESMNIHEMCSEIVRNIDEWGWLPETKINNKHERLHTIKGAK
jgi:hypothetical protein